MEIELRKWGNSIGLRIPHQVAKSLKLDEQSIVELKQEDGTLMITKKEKSLTPDQLLDSIPNNFSYPDDVQDFINSQPEGQELI